MSFKEDISLLILPFDAQYKTVTCLVSECRCKAEVQSVDVNKESVVLLMQKKIRSVSLLMVTFCGLLSKQNMLEFICGNKD